MSDALTNAGPAPAAPLDFIRQIVTDDLEAGRHGRRVHTRFPPEPNGYLHIGHAKSICLNFGVATEFGGLCNLRLDDTNPTREDVEYVDSIRRDVQWLGFDWGDREYYASDYFERMYECAVTLIRNGRAYVDSLSAEEIREYRGTLTQPGRNSPYRERDPDESLVLIERMRQGEFPDGAHVVRARIDMAAPNINLRDPTLFRIRHAHHHRTGDRWRIYPMYDFAHALSDALEGITHSLCTLEFEDHRPLYNWIIEQFPDLPGDPQQIEFARLNLTYTVLSKRKLLELVERKMVHGWDDPRMPTISGMRRRGYTPEAIRNFCARIGVAKNESLIDVALLEHSVREHLNRVAPRAMAVLRPLKVVIENYPEGQVEMLEAINNPEDATAGTRQLPFSRELYIEQDDFREEPPKKFFRLFPGNEVRLRYAYIIRCTAVIKNDAGAIVELRCRYDPDTRGGSVAGERRVKGTLHWVSAARARRAEVRLYDRLFSTEQPGIDDSRHFAEEMNQAALETVSDALVEPSLAEARPGTTYQFERLGYFAPDADGAPDRPVFNRTVTLRDSWAKIERAQNA
ncbi:MAG: glutamine--tRNA ligase/YqeY domain fusion protein [Actinomycetota bacterium]|nr:glutamine--tRNA ligase/YqeY domain fusion protein [Actinomycetota bacterium]